MRSICISELAKEILGREESFMVEELDAARSELLDAIEGSRILVIGAAGSIGSAFVGVVLGYNPGGLHLVDISENNLVEVVRGLRSSGIGLPEDFSTFAVDYTTLEFEALLKTQCYDYVLNFSALKHVRSERDPFTLMRMLEVNVRGNDRLANALIEKGATKRLFSVSSDKAVQPASLMGASKAFMERILLSHAERLSFSSARFANVLFSDGSLPHSFLTRLAKGQPLSAPTDVRRYFISHEEAGQLCLLACFAGGNGEIFFPKFDPAQDMMTFSEIARDFLKFQGLEVQECSNEEEARQIAKEHPQGEKSWPCHFTPSNTSGEKDFEEFTYPSEICDDERYPRVGVVTEVRYHGREPLELSLEQIQACLEADKWGKEDLVRAISEAVPELDHVDRMANLDQKM